MSVQVHNIEAVCKKNGLILGEMLGNGTFGSVFKCEMPPYSENFVVKQIETKKYFINSGRSPLDEAKVMYQIGGTGVVSIYKYFQEGNFTYIVMEYCPNGTLKEYINKNHPLKKDEVIRLARLLIYGLQTIHSSNIVHRDIKPDNIVFDRFNRPKYTDFGLSEKLSFGETLLNSVGSPAFMAPDLFAKKEYDPYLADIWSLGVTIYALAAGRLPFHRSNRHDLIRDITNGFVDYTAVSDCKLSNLIKMMLIIDPKQRASLDTLLSNQLFVRNGTEQNIFLLTSENKCGSTIKLSSQSLISNKLHLGRSKTLSLKRKETLRNMTFHYAGEKIEE